MNISDMTDEQLQEKAEMLHAVFGNMPNTDERKYLFIEWARIRAEQSKRIYWSGNRNHDDKTTYREIK